MAELSELVVKIRNFAERSSDVANGLHLARELAEQIEADAARWRYVRDHMELWFDNSWRLTADDMEPDNEENCTGRVFTNHIDAAMKEQGDG